MAVYTCGAAAPNVGCFAWRAAAAAPFGGLATCRPAQTIIAAMEDRPGQEFLAQKLQRAREVPEAARCPAVAAFVASEDLMAAVRELLPVQGSEPALAATAANQRQVACAYALAARACYLCPCPPVNRPDGLHIYLGFLPELNELLQQPGSGGGASASSTRVSNGAGGGGSASAGSSDFDLSAAILDKFTAAALMGRLAGEQLLTAAAEGLRLLQLLGRPDLMAAVDRQLALFEAPRLTAQQLRYAVAHETARNAAFLLTSCRVVERFQREQAQLPRSLLRYGPAPLRLSNQQKARLSGALSAATAVLLQLEPGNPKTYAVAAAAQEMLQRPQQACDLYLRGIQLAQQHRSDYYLALLGMQFMQQASAGAWGAGISRASAEAAVAAYPEAAPALRRCKRLLPLMWTVELDALGPASQQTYTAVQQQLLHGRQADLEAVNAVVDEPMRRALAVDLDSLHCCSFCGQHSEGLRLCSQCKQARYCSTECQRQAWRAGHKQECRPAGQG